MFISLTGLNFLSLMCIEPMGLFPVIQAEFYCFLSICFLIR